MSGFKRGDMVRHQDGREGMVERTTADRVTVQFPNHWRSSSVLASRLTLIRKEEERQFRIDYPATSNYPADPTRHEEVTDDWEKTRSFAAYLRGRKVPDVHVQERVITYGEWVDCPGFDQATTNTKESN